MKFYPCTIDQVKSVPKVLRSSPQNKLLPMLNEFVHSGAEAARLEFYPEEYISVHSAFSSLYNSIKYGNLPLHVEIRSHTIYITRTDLFTTDKEDAE
jgi:hypothetical protein|nr:MAG TPA: hypothetical protein [Podoviridae sp. ctgHy19]